MKAPSFAFVLLLCTGCSNSMNLLNSKSYTSTNPSAEWSPSKPLKGPREILPLLETVLPSSSELMTLTELLNVALSNNPSTQYTWAKAKAASYAYQESLAPYFPEIDLSVDATKQHQSFASAGGTVFNNSQLLSEIDSEEAWGPTLVLTYTIWDFGQRSAHADAYMQALHAANWSHNEMIQSVLRSTLDAYFTFLFQKERLKSLKVDLDDLEVSYDAAKQKLLNGVNDITDMLQAKTAYLAKKIEYESQVATQETSYQNLLHALGVPGNSVIQTGEFPDSPSLDDLSASAEELTTLALAMRPDIAMAKATLLEQEALLKEAKAKLWPTIQTTVSGGELWIEHQNGAQPNYTLQLSLSYPVFAGFKYLSNVQKAKANVQKSQYALRMQELNVTQQVQVYYTEFEQARKLVTTSQEYLEAAEEEFIAILSNYERGTRTILDVLSAVSNLANARSEYVDTKNKLYSSLANIAYATGMLTSKATSNTPPVKRFINE